MAGQECSREGVVFGFFSTGWAGKENKEIGAPGAREHQRRLEEVHTAYVTLSAVRATLCAFNCALYASHAAFAFASISEPGLLTAARE